MYQNTDWTPNTSATFILIHLCWNRVEQHRTLSTM